VPPKEKKKKKKGPDTRHGGYAYNYNTWKAKAGLVVQGQSMAVPS
jgi:hypothetical protein